MRLGIYGGSFDPIHIGHLLLAECCREACQLDRVRFVPAAVSPHKADARPTSATHRWEMLRLSVGGYPPFEVSDWEIRRGGLSYTVDTLAAIREELPQAELFFLMGADTLADFPQWRAPETICRWATLVVVHRPGSPAPVTDALPAGRGCHVVTMPQIDISSSDIRDRVAQGRSIRFQVPGAVEALIGAQRLYRAP